MAQKRKPDQNKKIMDAALSHAGKVGWDALTIRDIAKKAKMSEEAVTRIYADVWDILLDILKKLDADTLAEAGKMPDESWRDNLFEILMSRFDVMEEDRHAFTALSCALARAPAAAPRFVRPFGRSMRDMLQHAGAPATPLHVAAFGIFYLSIVEVWKNDETADLSKTMAAVDKRLGMLERFF